MNLETCCHAISDVIHSDLKLPEACYKIIDTFEFQRLRFIKQLGTASRVYPSASHTRFEHAIGASHLAGKYVKMLQAKQPELNITETDVISLYLAGLVSDLGGGPFASVWTEFMTRTGQVNYSPGVMSTRMLDYVMEENGLTVEMLGLRTAEDIVFVKELIVGKPLDGGNEFKGRGKDKWFLYQIVTNLATTIDTVTFDATLRDANYLNLKTAFDTDLIMNNTYVSKSKEGEESTLTYAHSILDNLLEFGRAREHLYFFLGGRKVVRIIEEMMIDVLLAADEHFVVTGKDEQRYKLSNAYEDLAAFCKLTDTIVDQIYNWGNGGDRAKRLLDDIMRRKLYPFVNSVTDFMTEFMEVSPFLSKLQAINPTQVVIIKTTRGFYPNDEDNPLNKALFYGKQNKEHTFRASFATSLRKANSERIYIILRPGYAFTPLGGCATPEERGDDGDSEDLKMLLLKGLVNKYLVDFGSRINIGQ